MILISWNVNGIRAIQQKGFMEFFQRQQPDIFCLQEIKARPDQVTLGLPPQYQVFWNPAVKPGYSGTAIITRAPVLSHQIGPGDFLADSEGRVLTLELQDFFVVNVYTPNVQDTLARLGYRHQEWDPQFRKFVLKLGETKPVLICGDLNVAHQEIDLARPKPNIGKPGFTEEERQGISKLLEEGWVDTFRHFCKDPGHYTWWSYRAGARQRNVGWRIDYWLASQSLVPRLRRAWILPEVLGSDHCPVGLEIE
ncbi:MAG: exodeoxyribonuclease III [Verrucomicrobiales bacterium]